MREELSSLNPYEFFSRNLNYSFITEKGIEYYAYFVETGGYFDNYPQFNSDIYSFGFAPKESKTKAFYLDENGKIKREKVFDLKIRDTVLIILREFIEIYPNKSIISICDNTDRRERNRHQLFCNWYELVNKMIDGKVTKYDSDIYGIENFYAHASIFVRNDNINHERIKFAFYDIRNELIAKGY